MMKEEMSIKKLIGISYDEEHMASDLHHDPSNTHQERPFRIRSILNRLKCSTIDNNIGLNHKLWDYMEYIPSKLVSKEILLLCHTESYLDVVKHWTDHFKELYKTKRGGRGVKNPPCLYPLDEDTYMTPDSGKVANLAVGSVISICDELIKGYKDGKVSNSSSIRKGFAIVRPPGHHATSNRMMGFCIYNNIAIAAMYLRKQHELKRIAIIDWDVHQGNGTQEIFYGDPNVLFVSIHRYGTGDDKFYPYIGSIDEMGEGPGLKYNVNIPLEREFEDADLMYAFSSVVIPLLDKFKPEFILVSSGFDAAKGDLLGGCNLSPKGYAWATTKLCTIADKYSEGRLLLVLEGGYEPVMLSKCVEAVTEALLIHELNMGRTADIKEQKDSDLAKPSTINICSALQKLLEINDIIPEFKSLRLLNGNFGGDVVSPRSLNIKWKPYPHKLSDNIFVIAGGHQNQWILPTSKDCNEVAKLCSERESAFYEWLYVINRKPLTILSKETENMRLEFANGLEDTCLSGLRFIEEGIDHDKETRTGHDICAEQKPLYRDDVAIKVIDFITECSAICRPSVFKKWELSCKHTSAIRIRNALYGMKEPCVMDLKMGSRLYGDDCTDPKLIKKKEKKAKKRSCKTHGFHLSGMFKWNRTESNAQYLPQSCAYSMRTDYELVESFKLYFMLAQDKEIITRIIDKLLSKLNDLKDIFEKQKYLAFYGSSLLFVFDSDKRDPENIVESANVYIIDLSHVSHNVGEIDSGYLLGVTSIIRLLEAVKDDIRDRLGHTSRDRLNCCSFCLYLI
ncbi:conserved hypothetical protein [Theileria equi strain WA]|uniref:histone deacetylase n=1 Tax=Theileria equi strain WA TaxID=1537102 RepID=L1LCI0_THEEQ|nr:conserved hypothetical protein [Theileria equi strain WA]EKX73147.1 conserved hypothetical protein [Theileria equi strain WA]|eukprot:XP_004832599.1 conserved hypothetical protein [Theileria equi strain WA]